ncbi:hypothetical protein HGA88_06040 [Candidatus Roizmanbacteria bacterium]|nr:hypothetical protein [Candidatus Roizmanbacteria bacterium]
MDQAELVHKEMPFHKRIESFIKGEPFQDIASVGLGEYMDLLNSINPQNDEESYDVADSKKSLSEIMGVASSGFEDYTLRYVKVLEGRAIAYLSPSNRLNKMDPSVLDVSHGEVREYVVDIERQQRDALSTDPSLVFDGEAHSLEIYPQIVKFSEVYGKKIATKETGVKFVAKSNGQTIVYGLKRDGSMAYRSNTGAVLSDNPDNTFMNNQFKTQLKNLNL